MCNLYSAFPKLKDLHKRSLWNIYSFITVLNCLNIAYTKFGALPETNLVKAEAQKNLFLI